MSEGSKTPKSEVPLKSKPVKPVKVVRPASPQPSTSTASTPSTSSGSSRPTVYSHIDGIEGIPHLRSFRPGRRRSLYRMTSRARLAKQYEQAIRILEPLFAEETRRQEEAATYVESAIELFAITVNEIADQLEGKTPNENAANHNKLRRHQQRVSAKAKIDHPEQVEGLNQVPEKVDEKEETKRLQAEIEAAITAITTGDKKGEKFPTLFTEEVVKSVLNLQLNLANLSSQVLTPSQDKKPVSEDKEI